MAEEICELLPVAGADGEPSHLAVRLAEPAGGRRSRFTFLYLHGFGSKQSGEKADFFRARALEGGMPFCSFDFQGHGESGGRMRDLTFSRNLDDLAAVHDFLAAQSSPDHLRRAYDEMHPIGRVGTIEEVANVFLFLASNEASFVTGANYQVDGGISVKGEQPQNETD